MTRGEPWAARINVLVGTCADAAGGHAVLPDDARLAIGHADGTVRCVELATGDTVWFGAERHAPVLQSLACSPDGQLLATVADDCTIRVWDAATGAVIGRHVLPAVAFELRFSPDGARLATAGADDSVGVYRVDGGERLVSCTGHEAWVQSVDWSPRGDRLASVSNDGTLRIWDAATGAELERRELRARAQAVAWSPSGSWLAVGLEGGDAALLDAAGPFAETHRLRVDPERGLRPGMGRHRPAAGDRRRAGGRDLGGRIRRRARTLPAWRTVRPPRGVGARWYVCRRQPLRRPRAAVGDSLVTSSVRRAVPRRWRP
ncbi:MAG TPA: hypothetical protein VHT91_33520 [Kofleriaceae bacterium]|jgi:hypothetical protein|nr:hypothetical protein [Kofleriaceae bacterium]